MFVADRSIVGIFTAAIFFPLLPIFVDEIEQPLLCGTILVKNLAEILLRQIHCPQTFPGKQRHPHDGSSEEDRDLLYRGCGYVAGALALWQIA